MYIITCKIDAKSYYNRGNAKYELGDKTGAIADYTQAIIINPQDAKAYGGRGVIYLLTGNKQEGIKDLETAKQLYQQQGDIQKAQIIQETLNKL